MLLGTYSVCVSVALGIQHAKPIRHIVMCPARLSDIFHYDFRQIVTELKFVFRFSLQIYPKHYSF